MIDLFFYFYFSVIALLTLYMVLNYQITMQPAAEI